MLNVEMDDGWNSDEEEEEEKKEEEEAAKSVEPSKEEVLLTEIRDLLKEQNTK